MNLLRPQSPRLKRRQRSRTPRAIYKDKDLDSDIESEDDNEDDHSRDGDGKRPLTIRQAALASVVGSSRVSLDGFMFPILSRLIIRSIDETSRKKQLNEAKITLWREETAYKQKYLSEKLKRRRRSLASGGQGVPLFSMPPLLLPVPYQPALDGDEHAEMVAPEQQQQQSKPRSPAVCDVEGCPATSIGWSVIGNAVHAEWSICTFGRSG